MFPPSRLSGLYRLLRNSVPHRYLLPTTACPGAEPLLHWAIYQVQSHGTSRKIGILSNQIRRYPQLAGQNRWTLIFQAALGTSRQFRSWLRPADGGAGMTL
jgi:hypothetical protein